MAVLDDRSRSYLRTLVDEDLSERDRVAAVSWRIFMGDVHDEPIDGADWRCRDDDNPWGE